MIKKKAAYSDPLAYYKIANFLKDYITSNTTIICIGTDRCIGDSLGPLIGTFLKESHIPIPVYGTLDEPIHALNIENKLYEIKNLHPNHKILGIDACLGDKETIGEIQGRNYPIHPGKGVGKVLPDVGDISLIGIVDSCDNSELFSNNNIRLNFVMKMARVITHGILHSYYLYSTHCTLPTN